MFPSNFLSDLKGAIAKTDSDNNANADRSIILPWPGEIIDQTAVSMQDLRQTWPTGAVS